ncbi:hypothetical protein [Halorubrum salinum]|uniref:hypothetical protein n=1 Tax=Halorubrum salinum TaxID=767517 RepID=UPI002111B014|nr:hypothetical protein [Halorubrum salinum]
MRSDDRSRLDRVLDGLEEAAEKARKDTQKRLNDRYLVEYRDEPGAPNLKDYSEDEIDEYLFDLHEWAREQYAERVDELREAADIDASEYPELGGDRRADRNKRADQSKEIVGVGKKLARVDEARGWLDQIEDEWRER